MAKRLSQEVEQEIAAMIDEALRQHTAEHLKDLDLMQIGFDTAKQEINKLGGFYNDLAAGLQDLGELHNTLASQVKDSHDKLVNSTADLLKVMMEDITDLENDVEDLKDRLNTLSERVMQHLEAGGSK